MLVNRIFNALCTEYSIFQPINNEVNRNFFFTFQDSVKNKYIKLINHIIKNIFESISHIFCYTPVKRKNSFSFKISLIRLQRVIFNNIDIILIYFHHKCNLKMYAFVKKNVTKVLS